MVSSATTSQPAAAAMRPIASRVEDGMVAPVGLWPSGCTYSTPASAVTSAAAAPILDGIGLCGADLIPGLEPAVVSTGLRYLVVPVSAAALARAAITAADFAGRLAAVGAQFAYLLDPDGLEGRHWTNDGGTEDIATGSAAGTVGAYLARAGRVALNQPFTLHQGRFAGRPSQIQVEPRSSAGGLARILVGGQVALVAAGTLRNLPGVIR